VHAQREVVDVGLLTSQIEDTDLGVGNTTVEPGLRVGLYPTHPVSNHPPHSTYRNNKSIQAKVNRDDKYSISFLRLSKQVLALSLSPQASFPIQNPQNTKNSHKISDPSSDRTHLVLAVAVASRGTTGHCDCWKWADCTSCER
jgi:hypothetical protein